MDASSSAVLQRANSMPTRGKRMSQTKVTYPPDPGTKGPTPVAAPIPSFKASRVCVCPCHRTEAMSVICVVSPSA